MQFWLPHSRPGAHRHLAGCLWNELCLWESAEVLELKGHRFHSLPVPQLSYLYNGANATPCTGRSLGN